MGKPRHIDEILQDEVLRYSQVWEDHHLLEEAFSLGPSDHVLSICSAGANALALLAQAPASVTAVDLNPTQTALLHLKVAGITHLHYDEFIVLMGARTGRPRWQLYQQIRHALPDPVQHYWDRQRVDIEAGLLGAGKLERYFDGLRQSVVCPHVTPEALSDFLACESAEERAHQFERSFGSDAFRESFIEYTGQAKVAASGRDPTQFKFVEIEDSGSFFFKRFKEICLGTHVQTNFYLEYFLCAAYSNLHHGPPYLRHTQFLRLRSLLPRLEIVTEGIDSCLNRYPTGHFSHANLSDIFEYLSEAETQGLMEKLATHMRVGGRIAYWNHLVLRRRPESLSHLLEPLADLSKRLYGRDRGFSYRGFQVDQVLSG